jgi:hypothetical protein
MECYGLNSITIPSGITKILDMAFLSCTSLVHVSIRSTTLTFGKNPFWGCTKLITINYYGTKQPSYSTATHQQAYHGKAAAADATISSVAKSLGWPEDIWDLSGEVPTLK